MADLLARGFPTADVFAGQRRVGRPAGLTVGRAYFVVDVSNGLYPSWACLLAYSVSTCHMPGAYTSSQTSSGPSSSEKVFTSTRTGTGVPGSTSTWRACSS